MEKTNWIILSSHDRGIDYGVGSYIKKISKGLKVNNEIKVYILKVGIITGKSFTIRKHAGITFFDIPVKENSTGVDTIKNQEKLALNIARIILHYIPTRNKNVILMNFVYQFFIAKELKKILSGTLLFVQHILIHKALIHEKVLNTEFQVYDISDKIITVTRQGKENLIRKGVSADKIVVIYNGINPEDFNTEKKHVEVRQKYGLTRNEKLILYSGRIDPVKGLDYLCASIKQLIEDMPGCRLVIAGNGSYESIIPKTGEFSANVSYLGFIPFEDLVALYHIADIGVIPSLEEQCSYVALEMLHSGLPVVASSVGGLKEIFIHDENALLADVVPDKSNMYGIAPDVKQFKNYMLKLLSNKKLRDKFSANAIARANRYFTLKNMANRYLQTDKNIN